MSDEVKEEATEAQAAGAKPARKRCPKCGSIMLEKGRKLVCWNENCGYTMDKPEEKDQ